jgi:hypothetical protein
VFGLLPPRATQLRRNLKLHLHRMVELEYVVVHRAMRGHGVSYELVLASTADQPAQADGLRNLLGYDPERSDLSGSGRPSAGGRSGGGRTPSGRPNPAVRRDFTPERSEVGDTHLNGRLPTSPVG